MQGARGLLLRRRRPELAAVEVGAEEVRVPAGVLVRHPSPVAGRDDRGTGVAVVRAVGRQHRVAAGVQARHADGVLVGVRAAVGEEHLGEPAGRLVDDALGRLAAREVRGRRPDRREGARLLLDRLHDGGMLVPDVDVDELAREVQHPVAGVVPDRRARPAGDHGKIEVRLRQPGVEHELAIERLRLCVQVFIGHGVRSPFAGVIVPPRYARRSSTWSSHGLF